MLRTLCLLACLFAAPCAAQDMTPVRDFTLGTATTTGGATFPMCTHNAELICRWAGLGHGDEVWATDGTAAGTRLFVDVQLSGSSQPQAAFSFGSLLLFSVNDGYHGTELWRTNGTAAGTFMLADINPGSDDSYPMNFIAYGGFVYFSAFAQATGRELYRTDGSQAGTTLVLDIESGASDSAPTEMRVLNSLLVFSAHSSASGRELWRSNGTAAGTVLIRDLKPGISDSNPSELTHYNGELYFRADHGTDGQELCKTDGTTSGTMLVVDLYGAGGGESRPSGLCVMGSDLYFFAKTANFEFFLWRSDGTQSGTVKVDPGTHYAMEGQFTTELNGVLIFRAEHSGTHREIWRSDGTAAGTYLLKDIFVGSSPSEPQKFTVLGSQLMFVAQTSTGAFRLFKTDGTTNGTVEVFNTGMITAPLALGSNLYFGLGDDIWRSDGTMAGTQRVADIRSYGASSFTSPVKLRPFASGAVYVRNSNLWTSNGTWAGTGAIQKTAATQVQGTEVFVSGSQLLFSGFEVATGVELWTSDGTAAGTVLLADLNVSSSTNPSSFIAFNGQVYFQGNVGSNWGLYRTDGTTAGTQLVLGGFLSPLTALSVVGTDLYFMGRTAAQGYEPWISDGSTAGTTLLSDIRAGTTASSIGAFFDVSGTAVFAVDDGINGMELWRSDGTPGGTQMILDILAGAGSGVASGTDCAVMAGNLYFRASNGAQGEELWRSDGTAAGTVLVRDIFAGATKSAPTGLVTLGSRVLFVAASAAGGRELWSSDGTSGGTVQLVDAWPGPAGGISGNPEVAGSLAYFVAGDGFAGARLWSTSGTPGTTQALNPAPPSNGPFTASGFLGIPAGLLFTGSTYPTGRELFLHTGDSAPYVRPAAGSALVSSSSGGDGISYATGAGTTLVNASLELFDASPGAAVNVNIAPASSNGIVAPTGGTGLASGATLVFTGTPTSASVTSFTVQLDDGVNPTQVFTIRFDITGNTPPTLTIPSGSTFSQISGVLFRRPIQQGVALFDANLVITDPSAGASIDVTASPQGAVSGMTGPVSATGQPSGTTLTWTGTPTAIGTFQWTISLNDGTSVTNITVEIVVSTNTPPAFSLPTGTTLVAISAGVYRYNGFTGVAISGARIRVNDSQVGPLTVGFSPGITGGIAPPTGGGSIVSGTNFEFTGTPTAPGLVSFTATATDGFNSPVSVTIDFVIVTNNPPVAQPTASSAFGALTGSTFVATLVQGVGLANADLAILDSDAGASLSYTFTPSSLQGLTAPANQSGRPSGTQMSFTGTSLVVGQFDFTMTLSDGIAATVVYTIRIDVQANPAPYVELPAGSAFWQTGPLEYELIWPVNVPLSGASFRVRDPGPTQPLSLGCSATAPGVTPVYLPSVADGTVGFFTGTPTTVGDFLCPMHLQDGASTVWHDVWLRIVAGPVAPYAYPPAASTISGSTSTGFELQATVGTPLSQATLTLADPNVGETISVTLVTGAAPGVVAPSVASTLAIGSNILWTGTPTAAGLFVFSVTLQDSGGLIRTLTLEFTVTGIPSAPGFASVPPTVAYAGVNYVYTIQLTGNPVPGLTVSTLPAWLTLTGDVLSGTPGTAEIGTPVNILLTAANGVGTDAQQFFVLQVAAAPSAPAGDDDGDDEDDSGCVVQVTLAWPLAWPLVVLVTLARRKRA